MLFNLPWGSINYGPNSPLPWGNIAPVKPPVVTKPIAPQMPVGQMTPGQVTSARLGNFQQFGRFDVPKGAKDQLGQAIQSVPSNRMLGGRK